MSKTRVLVQAAMLVAISVILTRFLAINASIAGVHALRLSFGEIPLMLAGLLFGPAVGALAGVSADLVGISLFPPPAIFPGFTLSAALTGALPPLALRAMRSLARVIPRRRNADTLNRGARKMQPDLPIPFGRLFTVVLFTGLVISGLNTVWLHLMFSTPYALLLPPRLIADAILIPAHALVTQATLRTYAIAFLGASRSVKP